MTGGNRFRPGLEVPENGTRRRFAAAAKKQSDRQYWLKVDKCLLFKLEKFVPFILVHTTLLSNIGSEELFLLDKGVKYPRVESDIRFVSGRPLGLDRSAR